MLSIGVGGGGGDDECEREVCDVRDKGATHMPSSVSPPILLWTFSLGLHRQTDERKRRAATTFSFRLSTGREVRVPAALRFFSGYAEDIDGERRKNGQMDGLLLFCGWAESGSQQQSILLRLHINLLPYKNLPVVYKKYLEKK